jgi:hypothetical protein
MVSSRHHIKRCHGCLAARKRGPPAVKVESVEGRKPGNMRICASFVKWLVLPICLSMFVLCGEGRTSHPDVVEYKLACQSPNDYMLQDFGSGTASILSPNKKSQVLLANDFSLRVLHEGQEIGTLPPFNDMDSNLQVMWAPDSEKFSITYSNGGETGIFYAHIFGLGASGITEFAKPPQIAFDDFKKKYYCAARGDNISALGWTLDSSAVFLMTEVYPTSDCGSIWGKEGGYLMDLDGKILRRYGDRETQRIEAACDRSGRIVLPVSRQSSQRVQK